MPFEAVTTIANGLPILVLGVPLNKPPDDNERPGTGVPLNAHVIGAVPLAVNRKL